MRKRKLTWFLPIIALLTLTISCTNNPDWDASEDGSPIIPGQPGDGSSSDGIDGTLLEFDITIDESDLSGDDATETVITDKNADGYDDCIENSTFTKKVYIHYNGNTATIDNVVEGGAMETNEEYIVEKAAVKEREEFLE